MTKNVNEFIEFSLEYKMHEKRLNFQHDFEPWLGEIGKVNSSLKIENEKLTKDLKAVTSSRSEADGEIRTLEGSIQETQETTPRGTTPRDSV